MGEDLNENGARDQNATGDWNETDFLANDSDVDGVLDGLEVYGTWTYKDGTLGCSGGDKSACTLDPLNADTDGDQLRDGQELAGWTVGVWSEATMEKKETRNITSNPRLTDSDSDNLTDFQEFMNGSDPTRSDTDGDTISDWWEIQLKSNITGIDGTPPQISNVKLDIGIDWNWWGFLYLPLWSHVTVSFDVSDAVGLWNVQVTLFRLNGRLADPAPLVTWPWGVKATSYHFEKRWDISIVEAFAAGADVNISAEDVNGNMAWGQFHIKSIMEQAAAFIAALLNGIAHAIIEAASAFLNFILDLAELAIGTVLAPVVQAITGWLRGLFGPMRTTLSHALNGTNATADEQKVFDLAFRGPFFWAMEAVMIALLAVNLITLPWTIAFVSLLALLVGLAMPMIVAAIIGAQPSGGDPMSEEERMAPNGQAALVRTMLGRAISTPYRDAGYFDPLFTGMAIVFTILDWIVLVGSAKGLIFAQKQRFGLFMSSFGLTLTLMGLLFADVESDLNLALSLVGFVLALVGGVLSWTSPSEPGWWDPVAKAFSVVAAIASFLSLLYSLYRLHGTHH